VLKKAGIVVATAAAGLLAVSPLAFAGDKDDHDRDHRDHDGHKKVKIEDVNKVDDSNNGLINVSDNNVAVPVNVCDNNVSVLSVLPVQESIVSLTGALGLLGKADADSENTISSECEAEAEAGDKVKQHND
jgi:hypothetical protein